MERAEVLSALGIPARMGGRILFLPRYISDGFSAIRHWHLNEYARQRYGDDFYWRIWLLLDIKQLEAIERLINAGSDAEIMKLRETQLESIRLVALVVRLRPRQTLQLVHLELEANLTCRPGRSPSLSSPPSPRTPLHLRDTLCSPRTIHRHAHAQHPRYLLHMSSATRLRSTSGCHRATSLAL
jgi:hypothetical protein